MKLATLVKMGEKYLKAFPTPTTALRARKFGARSRAWISRIEGKMAHLKIHILERKRSLTDRHSNTLYFLSSVYPCTANTKFPPLLWKAFWLMTGPEIAHPFVSERPSMQDTVSTNSSIQRVTPWGAFCSNAPGMKIARSSRERVNLFLFGWPSSFYAVLLLILCQLQVPWM